jgi:L,D-transpeptidase ErfK/SrfK
VRKSVGYLSLGWGAVAAISIAVVAVQSQTPAAQFSTTIVGRVSNHEVRAGDTLRSLGARFGVDAATIAADNDLRVTAKLTPGQILRIDARHIVPPAVMSNELVINIPQRMLFHADQQGEYSAYPVAVGRPDWPTPFGAFTIVEKEEHPTWDVPRSIQEEMRRLGKPVTSTVPPGPDNPLGDYFLRLSFPSVGVHGTPSTSSIYGLVTHGCIRLHPDDIATLFPKVDVGAAGRLLYEPVLLARTAAGLFLEMHPDAYRRGPSDPRAVVHRIADAAGVCAEVDWRLVEEVVRHRHGIARPISVREPTSSGPKQEHTHRSRDGS